MILINFASILGKKRLRISKVITETKISRPTLTALYYNNSKGINFDTLDALCNYLQIQPGDLIKYYPVDVDEINITFIDSTMDLIETSPDSTLELTTNIAFKGDIKFIQRHLPDLNFSGALSRPNFIYETYDLDLYWNCTKRDFDKIANEDAWDEIYNQICQVITDECPYETGFVDNNFSIATVCSSFKADMPNDK